MKIRNIAIIAHVDHGKTTLVDELFKQSGAFRESQNVNERLMDSMDQERERGITIASKNGSFKYKDHKINIVDTPGHADFGGQVERVLKMADGVLLLVDAQEGPMPQTYFVLKKALANNLPAVVVINKIDKPNARPDWVLDQVFDLFVTLEAPDHILDFPVIYASAKDGYAMNSIDDEKKDMIPLLDAVINHLPAPKGKDSDPLQLQVASLDYSPFLGRLGIGKVASGTVSINQPVAVYSGKEFIANTRITKIFTFTVNDKIPVEKAFAGDIVAVAGLEKINVGENFTDPDNPLFAPLLDIDPPTISMNFIPNDSPFAGREGQFVTSRHIKERLDRETLSDVALRVDDMEEGTGFKVSGRGELHLSVLIEKMRREGYELQVTRPQVIYRRDENNEILEPWEELTVDVAEEYMGGIIEKLGIRKGQLQEMSQESGMTRLKYIIPTRGLLGFKSEFMSETRGMGVMNYVFHKYMPMAGEIKNRNNGVLVSMITGQTIAYALFNLQNRGKLFFGPGVDVYEGQILGEHCRDNDLTVNPAKGKKLTNVRAAGSDENVVLTPPHVMSLEECISYINDDELVEVTPESIRLRKI